MDIKNSNKNKKLIYLASPHSHTNSGVRQDRYQAALECTSWLIENGFWVFSPIVHSHNLPCNKMEKTISWEFWKEFDTETISRMDEVWVLIIPGWKESKGVQAEIEIGRSQGKLLMAIVPCPLRNDVHINEGYNVVPLDEELEIAETTKL